MLVDCVVDGEANLEIVERLFIEIHREITDIHTGLFDDPELVSLRGSGAGHPDSEIPSREYFRFVTR